MWVPDVPGIFFPKTMSLGSFCPDLDLSAMLYERAFHVSDCWDLMRVSVQGKQDRNLQACPILGGPS